MKQRTRRFNPSHIAAKLAACTLRDLSATNFLEKVVDPDAVAFARKQYEASIVKKFDFGGDSEALEEICFSDFLSRLGRVDETNHLLWHLEQSKLKRVIPTDTQSDLLLSLERARLVCSYVLQNVTMDEVFSRARHSSGASIGVPYSDSHLERKHSFPMSCTPRCAPLFDKYLAWDTSCPRPPDGERYSIVEGSRATTVPKETDKRRFIAVEPTCNMFLQQGLMAVLYDRLRQAHLDVTTLPEIHKRLAMFGSVSGSIATIDLRNASDSVSIGLARYLLPPSWFELIYVTRSDMIYIPGKGQISAPMLSTMGNAVTFPIETVIFYSLAVASVIDCYVASNRYTGGYKENPLRLISCEEERQSCSVFGDDCIIPVGVSSRFCYLLNVFGFEVNTKKSFTTGLFRESCGGDYYRMRNVRPMYVRTPHDDRWSSMAPWLYSTLNSLLKKYIQYFGELKYLYDKEAIRYIFSVFRENKLLVRLVPEEMPMDAGLHMIDHERLLRHYGIRITRLSSSLTDGRLQFSYHRFAYRERFTRNDNIRYWACLKYHVTPPDLLSRVLCVVREDNLKLRRIGGYDVAIGHSIRTCL